MGLITKVQVLAARQLQYEDVPVPELAPDDPEAMARICTMSGLMKDAWESAVYLPSADGKTVVINRENWRACLLAHCWVDENFERLFTTSAEVLALGDTSVKVLDRLYQVAKRLNVVGAEEEATIEKK